jgi:hypothetical protein
MRTEKRDPRRARLGRYGKAAQLVIADTVEPTEQRVAAACAQDLFGGP